MPRRVDMPPQDRARQYRCALGIWCLVLVVSGFLTTHPSSAGQKDDADDKNHPAVVEFRSIRSPSPTTELPPLQVLITPTAKTEALVLTAQATGLLGLQSSPPTTAPAGPTTRPIVTSRLDRRFAAPAVHEVMTIEIPMICRADSRYGCLVLTVEARDRNDRPVNTMEVKLNAYAADHRIYYGPQSLITLMQTRILDLERAGLISAEESLRRRRELTAWRPPATQPAVEPHSGTMTDCRSSNPASTTKP